jgi:hypothetical protein
MMDNTRGFAWVELDQVSLTAMTNPVASIWVHLESTGFEETDVIRIWVTTRYCGDVQLLSGAERSFLRYNLNYKSNVCQDRLVTDTGKVDKNEDAFLQASSTTKRTRPASMTTARRCRLSKTHGSGTRSRSLAAARRR